MTSNVSAFFGSKNTLNRVFFMSFFFIKGLV